MGRGKFEVANSFSRSLANRTGSVVVAANDQKAPEHKFPIPLDDCYAATRWVFDNAAELGLDATRIGVIGDSAGGCCGRNTEGVRRARSRLAYQVLVYPAVQYGWATPSALANAEGFLLQRATMEYFWNHYVTNPETG